MKSIFQNVLVQPARRIRRFALQMLDRAAFDWRYGTKTTAFVRIEDIATDSSHKKLGSDYQPTDTREFHRIIAHIPPPLANYTFVDFGCGKGRILLLAAQAGFRRIVGVEFSPDLAKIAEQNIAIFQHRIPQADIRIVRADAVEFSIPPENCVLYFFNPFRGKVMERVVENLRRSHAESPRVIHVALWHCEKSLPLFDALPFLHCTVRGEKHRNWLTAMMHEWAVYSPCPAPRIGRPI